MKTHTTIGRDAIANAINKMKETDNFLNIAQEIATRIMQNGTVQGTRTALSGMISPYPEGSWRWRMCMMP